MVEGYRPTQVVLATFTAFRSAPDGNLHSDTTMRTFQERTTQLIFRQCGR
jgi:hypothetical protein